MMSHSRFPVDPDWRAIERIGDAGERGVVEKDGQMARRLVAASTP
jgi:hypothetical protein